MFSKMWDYVGLWGGALCTSTMQSRAFSVVGPLVWNGLPLALRSLPRPRVLSQKFLQQLKTTLFGRAGVGSASE